MGSNLLVCAGTALVLSFILTPSENAVVVELPHIKKTMTLLVHTVASFRPYSAEFNCPSAKSLLVRNKLILRFGETSPLLRSTHWPLLTGRIIRDLIRMAISSQSEHFSFFGN